MREHQWEGHHDRHVPGRRADGRTAPGLAQHTRNRRGLLVLRFADGHPGRAARPAGDHRGDRRPPAAGPRWQAFAVSPGDFVALPHGVPHTFRVIGDEPTVMLQVHSDDSFLRFIRAVGQPAASHTLPPSLVLATGMDAALDVAARTGQPVIGPPMSAEAAAEVTVRPAAASQTG
jgi:hypothetical protein